jgi:hypothetical protein
MRDHAGTNDTPTAPQRRSLSTKSGNPETSDLSALRNLTMDRVRKSPPGNSGGGLEVAV